MIFMISLVLSCIVTDYVFFSSMSVLYEKKYSEWFYWLLYFLSLSLHMFVAWFQIPILNLFYSTGMFIFLSSLFYYSRGKTVLVNSVILIIYIAITDTIVTTAFSILLKDSPYMALQQDAIFFFITGVAHNLFMLCTYMFLVEKIAKYQLKKGATSIHLHLYMAFLLVFEFGVLFYLLINTMDAEDNIPLFLIGIGFVIVDGGGLYLYKLASQNAMYEKQAVLLEQQREFSEKYYQSVMENYVDTQKIIHDFKKHIQVIGDIPRQESKEYALEFAEVLNNMHQPYHCSDKIVNAILCHKIHFCERNHIDFEVQMQDVDFNFMDKVDVTALFANLLDNAIEACQRSGKEKPKIALRLHRYKGHIVINLNNTIGDIPVIKQGEIQTTKKNHTGMGILILRDIVNKHCGNLLFDYGEDYFLTEIILYTDDMI